MWYNIRQENQEDEQEIERTEENHDQEKFHQARRRVGAHQVGRHLGAVHGVRRGQSAAISEGHRQRGAYGGIFDAAGFDRRRTQGRFVELQGCAEHNPFTDENLAAMLKLAKSGLKQIFKVTVEMP